MKNNEDAILTNYLVDIMDKIFDPLPVAIIMLDKDGIIRMINKVFAEFLGFSKEWIC